MSHFPVLVTYTNETDVERQLERFYEQGEEGDYFMEKEVEITKDEMKEAAEKVIKEYEEMHKKSPEGNWGNSLEKAKEQFEAGKYGEVCTGWYGGSIDEEGNLYYVSNPDAKWDWWLVGGRWTGYFIKKDGAEGEVGTPGVMTDSVIDPNLADVIKVKDIDWDAMDAKEKKRRGDFYDEYKSAETKPFIWEESAKTALDTLTREEYINRPISHASFAVLHDNEWYERGSMGWWGVVSDEKDKSEWDDHWKKLIESLDPETEVTIVDCHI